MKPLLLLGPNTTEIRLGRSSIRTLPAMQGATNTVVVEVGTSRNDLGFDREVTGALHLAEIRRPARTHQGLQPALALRAHDLNLEVTATRCPARMIGGATGC